MQLKAQTFKTYPSLHARVPYIIETGEGMENLWLKPQAVRAEKWCDLEMKHCHSS